MMLIEIEKQTGAKRLHRKYRITNGDKFKFDAIHEMLEDDLIEFSTDLEETFKEDVESFRTHQRIALSAKLRAFNVPDVVENTSKQGTTDWLQARIGIITASKTPFTSKGLPIPTYDVYVNEKVADAFIENNGGEQADSYTSDAMQIGTDLEHYAIEDYEKLMGLKVEQRGLITATNLMIGASPDGVVLDADGNNMLNVEVKSVFLKTYIGQLVSGKVTNTYNTQLQVQMYILDVDQTSLVIQCQQMTGQPLMTLVDTVKRDEEFITNMIETIKQFEVDFKARYELLEAHIKTA